MRALIAYCEDRLIDFAPYEDGEHFLWHWVARLAHVRFQLTCLHLLFWGGLTRIMEANHGSKNPFTR